MKKRSIALLLALFCLLGFSGPSAMAAESPAAVVAIAPQFANARDFSDGRAAVFNGEKWGYIDETGRLAVAYLYDIAGDFSEGVAAVAFSEKGEYGKTPDVETWFLIDKEGKILREASENLRYSATQAPFLSVMGNGTLVRTPGDGTKAFLEGFRGNDLPVSSFTRGFAYAEGFAVVSTDATGSFTLPPEIAKAEAIATPATRGDMLVDFKGNILWREDWGMLLPPNRGLIPVHSRTTGLWGFADFNGAYVIEPAYEDFWYAYRNGAYEVFADGIATLYKNGVYAAVNTAGTVLFTTANQLGLHGEGLFPIRIHGQYGYCDAKGTLVIPEQYKNAKPFRNGVALVETAAGFYFIDKTGVRLHALPYADAGELCGGLARVQVMGQYGYVKITGRLADSVSDKPHQNWAQPEIDQAQDYGLLPPALASMYQTGITRAEMAQLTVQLLSVVSGKNKEELVFIETGKTLESYVKSYTFTDTANEYVAAAAALGIVNGLPNGSFAPHTAIVREDAAAMLTRTAKLAGLTVKNPGSNYTDRNYIASWAREYVDFVTAASIMSGIGDGSFQPRGSYTREQAIATMRRIFDMLP